jgi:hypothetical protein
LTVRRENYNDLIKLALQTVKKAEENAAANPTSDKIQVVIVEPQKKPYIKTIPNELKAFNEIVGGYIESYFIGENVRGAQLFIFVNEEGKLKGLPFNRKIVTGDFLAGTFLISAVNMQGDNISLTDQEAAKLVKTFTPIEVYV